jgi:hypothetical protein
MLKSALIGICGAALGLGAVVTAGQTQTTPAPAKPAASKAAPQVTLPPAIESAFKKAYPDATIKHVSKEKENGVEQYEVESMDGTQARDLTYKPDGTLVEYEELVPVASVPAAVVAAVKTKYPKATISRSEKLFKDGAMNYELELKGVKVEEVVLTPDGKWISPT